MQSRASRQTGVARSRAIGGEGNHPACSPLRGEGRGHPADRRRLRRFTLDRAEAEPRNPYAWRERSECREDNRLSGGRQSGREAP
jgi:hypothetical protein